MCVAFRVKHGVEQVHDVSSLLCHFALEHSYEGPGENLVHGD
jgi:hypothetical protein